MSTNDKYLVLRGKNKDIYFIQKRVSKKISNIIGKDFIKKSLETNNIIIARERRDKILDELKDIENKHKNVPTDSNHTNLHEEKNVPTKNDDEYKIEKNMKEKDFNDKNVLMEKADLYSDYNESDGYFSFIDYSKLPKKDDILAFLDKITPLAIAFLVIFVTLLV
tara:strand:+ start:749 stop:1243 length:495 start_codon:yes stop_codon:yes gene_type:complete